MRRWLFNPSLKDIFLWGLKLSRTSRSSLLRRRLVCFCPYNLVSCDFKGLTNIIIWYLQSSAAWILTRVSREVSCWLDWLVSGSVSSEFELVIGERGVSGYSHSDSCRTGVVGTSGDRRAVVSVVGKLGKWGFEWWFEQWFWAVIWVVIWAIQVIQFR